MACSNAAWVFGGVRLISSASNSWVKIGPLVSTKLLVWKLNRLVPSTSPGIRSGVNWMRPNCNERPAANARDSSVLAVPGTPSSRTWPPIKRLVSIRSMTASWPTTTLPTSLRIASVIVRMLGTSIDDLSLPLVDVTRQADQARRIASARGAGFSGLTQQIRAIDCHAPRQSHPLEPGEKPLADKNARRVELHYDIANGFLDVAADHHVLMTGELDQLGHVLQQAFAPGAERGRGRLRRPEPPQGCPQQERYSDQALHAGHHEGEA